MRSTRFGVVGVGPVGGIMAAYLRNAGYEVVLVDILESHMNAIRENGLRITGTVDMTVPFPEDDVCTDIADLGDRNVDVLFISVKAPVLPIVLPRILKVRDPDMHFVSLQNGLENEELLGRFFGDDSVLRFVVNYGGNIVGDGKLQMNFFNAPNYLGGIDQSTQAVGRDVTDALNQAGLFTEFTAEIKWHEWEKLILNLGLAALCSMTEKTMKEMMEYEHTRNLARELMREGIEVSETLGYHFPEDFLEGCMGWLDRTGYHMPSMAVDVMNDRRTEIDYLNAKVVEYGRMHGISTPYNDALTSLVRGRERPSAVPSEGQ
jgi:2-dehydropantoate 2-reductase